MQFVYLNARGTMIQIPKTEAFKSEILKTYFDKWNEKNEPFYLNYEPKIVHKLFDYLADGYFSNKRTKDIEKIKNIANELLIEINVTNDIDGYFFTDFVIQKMYKEFQEKYNDFKNEMKNYNVNIDESYNLSIFLSMMSYYKKLHVVQIYKLYINYEHINKPTSHTINEKINVTNLDEYLSKYGSVVFHEEEDFLLDVTNKLKEKISTDGMLFNNDPDHFYIFQINKNMHVYEYVKSACSHNDVIVKFMSYWPTHSNCCEEFKKKVNDVNDEQKIMGTNVYLMDIIIHQKNDKSVNKITEGIISFDLGAGHVTDHNGELLRIDYKHNFNTKKYYLFQ